jgi:hypothetical protein
MTDSLTLWNPSLSVVVTSVDLGTVMAGSSGDWRFQVKNLSAVYRATNVAVSLYGSDAEQFYLSLDGYRFTASLALGDLPPRATSILLTLRRVTPSGVGLGAHTCNLRIQAQTWH